MINLEQLWEFVKNPVYKEDEDNDFKYRLTVFRILLFYALGIGIGFGILNGILQASGIVAIGEHAINELLEKYSFVLIVFFAIVIAPIIEELIFRAPLVLFKSSPFFKAIFYLFTLVFGFYHITNFEITSSVLLFSPILVAPQISAGLFLGFIRVRFGLLWSIALHACYNLVLLLPVIIGKILKSGL